MKKSIFYLCLGFFFLILFYFFSLQVKHGKFTKINFDFTVRLQDKIPSKFDEPLEDVSFFISPILSVVWVGSLTLASLISIKHRKIYIGALLIPLFFALMIGVEVIGKARVESPAPPFFFLKNPTTMFPRYHVQEDYSYPSGHAARSLFFAGILSWIFWRSGKKKLWLMVTIASGIFVLGISLGKVYLGHHWLSDIFGGWIIASAFLCFSYGFIHRGFSFARSNNMIAFH